MGEVAARDSRWPDRQFLERSYYSMAASLTLFLSPIPILDWWQGANHAQKGMLDVPGMSIGIVMFATILALSGLFWLVYCLRFPRTMAISATSISKMVGGKVWAEIALSNIELIEVGRATSGGPSYKGKHTFNNEVSSNPAVFCRIHLRDGRVISLGFESNGRKLIQAMLAEGLPRNLVPPEWESARERLR